MNEFSEGLAAAVQSCIKREVKRLSAETDQQYDERFLNTLLRQFLREHYSGKLAILMPQVEKFRQFNG